MSVVASWTVADVEAMLTSLELGHLAPLFKTNGVTGKDLLTFGNSEYMDDLGCTKLQMRKIRRALVENGAQIKIDDNDPAAPSPVNPAAPAAAPAPAVPARPPAYPASGSPTAYPPTAGYDPFASNNYPPPAAGRGDDPFGAPTGSTPAVPASDPFAPQPAYSAYPPMGAPTAYPAPTGYPAPAGYPGSAPGYPGAAPMAAAAVAGVAVGVDLEKERKEKERYQQAHHKLKHAHGELKQAEQVLRQANMMTNMGMVNEFRDHRRPQGVFGEMRHMRNEQMLNMGESANMQRASQAVSRAAEEIGEAKALVPNLPDIDMAVVKQLRPGIVFPGGMVTDLIRKHKVQETLRHVEVMENQVSRAIHWLTARI